ncbi:hypothetical protein M595_4279 [Lyngbya aestuarii BL J]|uniref:Uncharacterized protein n=1 Tax=Lyngbya aestuarii BL J TaxID=1348334 RepID=U7QFB3_9CYAN|nr:hypothetical protein M595_4279 [Lyngbya aestuarii BL J]
MGGESEGRLVEKPLRATLESLRVVVSPFPALSPLPGLEFGNWGRL